MLIASHASNITWAFSLWGAKAAQLLCWIAEGVWFRTGGYQEIVLKHSILKDTVSVMNLGINFFAVIASGLASRFAPKTQLPWRTLAAAVIGGLLMG